MTALVYIVHSLPLPWVWSAFGGHVAPLIPAQVERVGGSIWNGYAIVRPHMMPAQRLLVGWDVSGWQLLRGQLSSGVRLEMASMMFEAEISGGAAGYTLTDANATLDLQLIEPMLREFSIQAGGVVRAEKVSVDASRDLRFHRADGRITWDGGSVSLGYGGGDVYRIPGVLGVLSTRDQGLWLTVTETASGKLLGEAGLSGDGIGSLTVFQRVMTMVGMQGASDDKILVKTQQPLF
jgi:general secretion pathway protein N